MKTRVYARIEIFWILGTHGGIHEREIYRAKIN
jgi:hypothetical protein